MKTKKLSEEIEEMFDIEYFGEKGRANCCWTRLNEIKELDSKFIPVSEIKKTIELKEKKTLSDKIILRSIPAIETLTGEEVKEALKEFIQWIHERLPSHDHHRGLFNTDDLDKKAKEIFGEKLVGD